MLVRLGLRAALLVIVLLFGFVMAAFELPRGIGLGDAYFPTLGNPGYDAQHYGIDLDIDVQANTISGAATMQALATDNLTTFGFDYGGPEISAIQVNDDAATFARDDRKLYVTPPAMLAKGAAFTVVVTYAGQPHEIENPLAYDAPGWVQAASGIAAAGAPSGSSAWYPVNEHPADKATYDFVITVPKPYAAVANGTLESVTPEGDQAVYHWVMRQPKASYVVGLEVGTFDTVDGVSPAGTPLRSYFASSLAAGAAALFSRQGEIVDYFSTRFGPYPFDSAGAVVVDMPLGFAMETQGRPLFESAVISRARPNDPSSGEGQIAHELSHQWFGDSVTLTTWQDIWLNEGFASWLWIEHDAGEDEYNVIVRQAHESLGGDAPRFLGQSDAITGDPSPARLFDWNSVCVRGALTLHALRRTVGDDAFFDILKTYTQKYRYGNASTADFIAVADAVSGRSLDDFFHAWLYDPLVPALP